MSTLTEKQLEVLEVLRERDPNLHYEVHRIHRLLTSMSGILSDRITGSLEAAAKDFVKANRILFGVEDVDEELGAPVLRTDSDEWTHITFRQFHKGIQVWSGRLTIHFNPKREIHSVSNAYRPGVPTDITPKVDKNEAIEIARKCGEHTGDDQLTREPQLVILPDDTPALAWVLALTGRQPSYEGDSMIPGAWLYFVDAINGTVIRRTSLVKETAQTSTGLSIRNPGRLTQVTRTLQTWHDDATGRDELRDTVTGAADGVEIRTYDDGDLSWDDDPAPLGDNTWDRTTGETSTDLDQRRLYQPAEVDAHHFGGELYRFWRRAPFNRNSFDNAGCDIQLRTHMICYDRYGTRVACHSAWWDGSRINLGDSDMTRYSFKSGQLDVFGHESTHAVFGTEIPPSGTTYCGQSGNFEEAFCDIFGCFTEHNWLFEELITVPPFSCLRNPSNPGDPNARSPGPDHYDDYDDTPSRCGDSDPHVNCHILSHACYLMTHGDVHHRAGRTPEDILVYPGFGWDSAERIYYRALTHGFTSDPGLGTDTEPYFGKVRTQVLLACEWAYGRDSCQYKTARLAFYAVGLQPAGESYGPDVMVTPWGDVTHHGPRWQSPDFYVLDAADNPAEPLLGQHNRLFVRVRNIGDQVATNVQVRVLYAPYSATYRHEHFKEIETSAPFTLNPGDVHDVEVDWDLTNLDEDNGGLWPPVDGVTGIQGYDHFCVRAEILCDAEADVNTCNNMAQSNFTEVGLAPGDDYDTPFIIPCPSEDDCWGQLVITQHLPRSWKVILEGAPLKERVHLHPGKPLVARLRVTASPEKELEPPIDGEVRGKFGARTISTRVIPLRDLGAFTGSLNVKRFYHRRQTFSGQLEGKLERTGQPFTAYVRGKVLDPLAMTIAGKAEGFLLSDHWAKHEPFVAEFEGELKPTREVSVSLHVEGVEPSGITIRFQRK